MGFELESRPPPPTPTSFVSVSSAVPASTSALSRTTSGRSRCGAHLEALRRTRAGQFRLDEAVTLEALRTAGSGLEDRLVGLNTLLPGMPAVTLTDEGRRRALNGNTLSPAHLDGPPAGPLAGSKIRVLDAFGGLLSVAEMRADGLLHPLLVLR